MSRSKIFSAIVLILAMAPMCAFADGALAPTLTPEQQAAQDAFDKAPKVMSYADAKNLIPGFVIKKSGSDPHSSIRFLGGIPTRCDGTDGTDGTDSAKIEIIKHTNIAGKVGFQISAPPSAVACLKILKDNGKDCSDVPCRKFSSTAHLTDSPDVEIVYLERDYNLKENHAVSLQPALFFKSAETYAAEADARARKDREERIKTYNWQVDNCRSNAGELAIARTALDGLINMDALDGSDVDDTLSVLNNAELDLLLKRVTLAKLEDLDSLRDKLLSWSAHHAGDDEKVAKGLYDIAVRVAGNTEADDQVANIKLAKDIISDAQSLDVNAASRKNLAGYQSRLDGMMDESMASGGWQNNLALQARMKDRIEGKNGLQKKYEKACEKFLPQTGFHFSFKAPKPPTQEDMISCQTAQNSLAQAQQVVTVAQRQDVEIQRKQMEQYQKQMQEFQQQQQQRQQQMYGQQNPALGAPNNGMGGLPYPANTSAPGGMPQFNPAQFNPTQGNYYGQGNYYAQGNGIMPAGGMMGSGGTFGLRR